MEYTVSVLNIQEFSKLIYDKDGMPIDPTVYNRIYYFSPNDFSWLQESNVKPYFTVLQEGSKIIGIAKIGFYSNNNFHEKDYSLSYFSIDLDYRNLGLSRLMADKLFEYLKNHNFELKTSSYTYVGKMKLQKILNDMTKKWDVKFTDRLDTDTLAEPAWMYDDNLVHKLELEKRNNVY